MIAILIAAVITLLLMFFLSAAYVAGEADKRAGLK